MKCALALLLALLVCPWPLAAETRAIALTPDEPATAVSFRPFFLTSGERFAAQKTFDGVFGHQALRPFWGAGVQVSLKRGIFVELDASRFERTGQRAFVFNGTVIPVGIPLTATLTTFEVTAGYRIRLTKWMKPYGAVGVTRYGYKEVSDPIAVDSGDNTDTSQAGFVAVGGAEFRVHKWVGVAAEAQYARVKGILGAGGISKDLGEDNLGGTAIRVKVLVGR